MMRQRYDQIGHNYSAQRRADPRISQQICQALGQSRSVLNVGAGAGSYEPRHLTTLALEPSAQMISQRANKTNVVQGLAEALPVADCSFDAVLAVLTIHHWANLLQGLQECLRVAKERFVILTWDPDAPSFWLTAEYFPEILELDKTIFPTLDNLRRCLGPTKVEPVLIPWDCQDGFTGAFWRRPAAYLSSEVRAAMSSFARIPAPSQGLAKLEADLTSGRWRQAHRDLLTQPAADLGYRLITAVAA